MTSRCITDTNDCLVPEIEVDANVYLTLHRKQTITTNNYRVEEPDPNDGYGSADYYPEYKALEDSYREQTLVDDMNAMVKFLNEILNNGSLNSGDKFQDIHYAEVAKQFIEKFSNWELEDMEIIED